ncbi:DUF2529 family protein [Pseudalkalibacillus sp. SCS-8]|uniref:DUF2529 family protein n=1 Tax=Pseudalkalibacillus nanhaiensis TaxID=3115291 RepID=UPI0032DA309F
MLKIFTTQLFGIFRKIQEHEEERVEDCARLLAQSVIGDGKVYIKGFNELESIPHVIMESEERISSMLPYTNEVELRPEDALLIFIKTTDDERLTELLDQAKSAGTSTITVGAVEKGEEPGTDEFHIDTKLLQGLVPDDEGRRIGYPTFMCALYVYYALFFTLSEMLEEYGMNEG